MLTLLRFFILAGLAVLSLLLGACGQKGDLYLPAIPEAPNVLSDGQARKPESDGSRDDAPKRSAQAKTEQDQ